MKSPVTTNSGCRGKVPGDHKLGLTPEFVADLWTLKKKIAPRNRLHYLYILSFHLSLSFSSLSSLLSSLSFFFSLRLGSHKVFFFFQTAYS